MSLTGALNSALSGLSVTQSSLALVSQNVANSTNPDFSRKEARLETVVTGNARGGVKIGEIVRIVDENLIRQARDITGDLGRADVQLPALDRLQNFFGEPGSDRTLTARLDQLFASLERTSTIPNSTNSRSEVVQRLNNLTAEIGELHTQNQALRGEADQKIVSEVNKINAALQRIFELNEQIAREVNGGGDPTEFQDLRDAQLDIIGERLSVKIFDQPNGTIQLFVGNSTPLIDLTGARILVYDPASTVTPQTVFSEIKAFDRDQNGNATGTGLSVQNSLTSGRIQGLLDLRDGALPTLSSELGEFAGRLTDEINRLHSNNTSFPPPNALVGARNTGFAVTDAHNFTGKTTFAVMDASNKVTSKVTVDFGTIGATLNDVINAVNAGLPGANGATLSLTNGVMSFTANAATDRVGIIQDATSPSSRAGRGFAHFFGLNDLLTTATPAFFDLGFTAGEAHQFTGTTTFRVVDSSARVVSTVTFNASTASTTFGGLASDLSTALGSFATVTLNATTGRMEINPASGFTVFAADETSADRAGTGLGLATMLGFGPDKVQQLAGSVQIASTIATDPTRIGVGQLQATVGGQGITPGDNRGVLALANLAKTKVSTNAAGSLPALTVTLGELAGSVIANAARTAADTQTRADNLAALSEALDARVKSISAVNIDEEMANLVVLQNSFSAAARLIRTVDEMLDDLLATLR